MKKLVVLIPCYNEEKTINKVISGIPVERLKKQDIRVEVIVIDNNSIDKTAHFAEKAGAKVIKETRKGKGYAMQTGFNSVPDDADYVIMIDGDNTYQASEIIRMIEPLQSNFCDCVLGSRLTGKMKHGSITLFNRFGNYILSFLVRSVYLENVMDVCTGYFAWNANVVRTLRQHITSSGFSLEMEMVSKMAKLGYSLCSVPITYELREMKSNLNPLADGIKILGVFIKYLRWKA